MITAGLDVGHQSINGVILDDQEILTHLSLRLAGEVDASARVAFEKLLGQAKLKPAQVNLLFATGMEREKISIADGHRTEMLCHLRGAHWLFPGVRTVIDTGAEGIRILKGDARGNLTQFVLNDKCAAGTGIFLETVAMMMRVSLEEMGPVSQLSAGNILLTSTCAVFAESEIVGQIHRGTSREDILHAVHESVASRISILAKRIGIEPEVVQTGGVARNLGVVEALKRSLELDIRVPEKPEIMGALGAALLARNSELSKVS